VPNQHLAKEKRRRKEEHPQNFCEWPTPSLNCIEVDLNRSSKDTTIFQIKVLTPRCCQ
jgi:hypothetical protein